MASEQTNLTSVAQQPSFLNRLPAEIRAMIYRHVFAGSVVQLYTREDETMAVRDRTASAAMLAVSKTCREEATAIFGSESTILASRDIDWHSKRLRELLLTNTRVNFETVKRLDQEIVLKQLGEVAIMANPNKFYCLDPEDMDIWTVAATVKSLFPALGTYFLTPPILAAFTGPATGGPRIGAGAFAMLARRDTEAEARLAVQQALGDSTQHGVAGFLNSNFVQSQLQSRHHPVNRWLYALAGARSRHADWSRLPAVIVDLNLSIHGQEWKAWPGIETHDWALDDAQIRENPTRFADRATPLYLPLDHNVHRDCVHGLVRFNLTTNTIKVLLGKSTVYLDCFGPLGAIDGTRL
ncbi:uncharacterized protein AB675_1895 [Cyphellophora attinorum]|uniref:DUF7730 domain-containing protein n=1 Tax=Cyphellophora attinorum TaxID=1664694 RepID=A0A0N1P2R7_9EURO|nr:uncharacterized protein AB675_1895 [Phialophora attinorum]KPI42883.1 hypothetical protein AB675_1895 [Phialophora attinorum]